MFENDIASHVIGTAIEVHRTIGPGLLESAYHECLMHELRLRDIRFESEFPIAVDYKGLAIGMAYRGDLLVENKVIVELKTVDVVLPVHKAQLLTYLRLVKRKLGLLINFSTSVMRDGIHRVVNNL
jgi:GxxExxY protein